MKTQMLKSTLLLGTAICFANPVPVFAQDATTETEAVEEARQLDTVVIRGEFIPEPQRATSQVATFLAPEDLERQGDSNAALALQRLSGLSVVGGRFVYVRGLGDRYSSALLNGSPLPSPEPLRRTVPLDLFPASVLNGAEVQKTFSAEFPGEFGGGVINLETLRQPNENFFNLKVGLGYNTETTGQDGIFVGGSNIDWTGFDDGLRNIPSELETVLASDRRLGEYSPAEIEAAGESLASSPLWVIQEGSVSPDSSFSAEGGYIYDGASFELGLVGVAGFSSGWETRSIKQQRLSGGAISVDRDVVQTQYDATLNALGSATIDWHSGHEVQGTLFYVHDTTKSAQISEGPDFDAPGSGIKFTEDNGWFERELLFAQLRGQHEFGSLIIDWRGSAAQATRDAPYERNVERVLNDDGVPAYVRADRNFTNFSELTDDSLGLGVDATYTIDFASGRRMNIMAGAATTTLDREYTLNAFRFTGGGALPDELETARPDFLFSPTNIDPLRFVLIEAINDTDNYTANLDVLAGYVSTEIDITDYLQVTAGARYEEAELSVGLFNRFGAPSIAAVDRDNDYILPSVLLNWNFADDLQLRLGYSETIARPQFRELAQTEYSDPDTNRRYRGFNGLVDTEFTNYDARLEYYFGRSQFATFGVFYKELTNPIEETQFESGTGNFISTFYNAPAATLAGAEVEYRTRFDFPISSPFFNDRDGIFSVNYTYTSSEVEASEGDIVLNPFDGREIDASLFNIDGDQLQGSPENIVNMQLGWESDLEQLTLLVGWVDERILQRGISSDVSVALPDVVEDPGIQIDLVYRRDFTIGGNEFTLGLSGRNLLDEDNEEFQITEGDLGRTEFNTYDRGQTFSASLTARF